MIVEVLKQKATLHENIRVISNDMIFENVSCATTGGIPLDGLICTYNSCRTNCVVFRSH